MSRHRTSPAPAAWGKSQVGGQKSRKHGGIGLPRDQDSDKNSYSSMTAATAILPFGAPSSRRTTVPLQRTRILSVNVISAGRVSVNSIDEPFAMGESTKNEMPRALTSRVCAD